MTQRRLRHAFAYESVLSQKLLSAIVCGDLVVGGAVVKSEEGGSFDDYYNEEVLESAWETTVLTMFIAVASGFIARYKFLVPEEVEADVVDVCAQTDPAPRVVYCPRRGQ